VMPQWRAVESEPMSVRMPLLAKKSGSSTSAAVRQEQQQQQRPSQLKHMCIASRVLF
jgi:hypothetical protein